MTKAAVIAAVAVAVPLLGWTAIAMVNNDDGDPPEASTTTPPAQTPTEITGEGAPPNTGPTSSPAAESTADNELVTAAEQAIETCGAQLSAGQAVVTEANTGVGHWSEHINARTDLLEGRNTDEETRAIWKRTRLAGPEDLERFAAVLSTYDKLSGCDDLAELDVPAGLRDDTQACVDRSTMTAEAVSAATDAIGDWSNHLDDMARHKDGHMTVDEAQDKWVESWENAPPNINAFNDARDDLEQAPACAGADE